MHVGWGVTRSHATTSRTGIQEAGGLETQKGRSMKQSKWNTLDSENWEPRPCRRCGKLLTAPRSLRKGIGATCRRRELMAERMREEAI